MCKWILREQIDAVYIKSKYFSCPLCDSSFADKSMLITHDGIDMAVELKVQRAHCVINCLHMKWPWMHILMQIVSLCLTHYATNHYHLNTISWITFMRTTINWRLSLAHFVTDSFIPTLISRDMLILFTTNFNLSLAHCVINDLPKNTSWHHMLMPFLYETLLLHIVWEIVFVKKKHCLVT